MSMTREKMALLAETEREDLDFLRSKAGDAIKDKNGAASNSLAGSLRFLAVTDYVLRKDVAAFRTQMSEAAELRVNLLERFDAGEAISPSYVSMMTYKSLLGSLASGNERVARALAACMGGREVIELEYDRPFERAFGQCLKSILEKDVSTARRGIEAFEQACKEAVNVDFKGYAKALRCIVDGETRSLPQAFDEILAGHRRQSVGSGLFKDTEDEMLCVWGVGIANLSRWNGLPPPAPSELLPVELVQ
jgi:hypothetical protein